VIQTPGYLMKSIAALRMMYFENLKALDLAAKSFMPGSEPQVTQD